MIANFEMMKRSLPKDSAKSAPLLQSVVRELDLWCDVLKTYCSLGKLGFLDSIIRCQKLKLKLNSSSNSCIQRWICKIFQSIILVLPIYFDRLSSDVIARYGFQESSFHGKPGENRFGQKLDLEVKLEEFLRLQERNGTSLVVAVVVDLAGFSILSSKLKNSSPIIGNEKPSITIQYLYETGAFLSSFPVVFLASTMQGTISSRLLINRRNSARKEIESEHILENNPNRRVNSGIEMDSWPFTSWNNVVSLLTTTTNPSSVMDDSVEVHWSQVDSDTLVFKSLIHEAMWFVAMKKTVDENRWSRRNGEELPRKEEQFLMEFAGSLRLRGFFESALQVCQHELDSRVIDLGTLLNTDRIWENDYQLIELLQQKLGLRSPTHKYSFRKVKQNSTTSPKYTQGLATSSLKNPSHFSFFLGSDLATLFAG